MKNTLNLFVLLIFICIIAPAQAQVITNTNYERKGDNIHIKYYLSDGTDNITIKYSTDGGRTLNTMNDVIGAVGRNVYGGNNEIVWLNVADKQIAQDADLEFYLYAKPNITYSDLKFGIRLGFSQPLIPSLTDGLGVSVLTGAYLDLKLARLFSLQAELLYSKIGAIEYDYYDGYTHILKERYILDYVHVPILLKLDFSDDISSFAVYAGPRLGYLFSTRYYVRDSDYDYVRTEDGGSVAFNSMDISISVGMMFRIFSIEYDIRYNIGLNEFQPNLGYKNSSFELSMGYVF